MFKQESLLHRILELSYHPLVLIHYEQLIKAF